MSEIDREREGREVVKGINKQHIVTVALSARVIAHEKVGQMACGCHSAARAFWQSDSLSATSCHCQ